MMPSSLLPHFLTSVTERLSSTCLLSSIDLDKLSDRALPPADAVMVSWFSGIDQVD
jgi:hypothetical protein